MNRYKRLSILTMSIYFMISTHTLAGTISGTVTYEGEIPEFPALKIDADPICLTHHTGPVFPQVLLLGENKTLANVFIHVVSGLPQREYPSPQDSVVLDQKGCIYEPHVLGVMVGQLLKVLNPDGTLHNVHVFAKKNQESNLAMPKFRTEITLTFDQPEWMFSIKCDVHPWMGGWISVMSHPFFSVTKADGAYAITDLPAGEYEIEAWHEKLGTKKVSVVLNEDETKDTNFIFSRPSE